MVDTGYWILDTGYWLLDTGCWILDCNSSQPVTCNFISEERRQGKDAGNQIIGIAHFRKPLDPHCPMSYAMRYALCTMPFALCTFARNSQPVSLEPLTLNLEP